MKKIDFLAIGDIVIDAFINLKDAHIHCKTDTGGCELCIRFGDKIPYENVDIIPAVGNSPNAAVCAARLGLKSALITAVGNDENGKDCLAVLKKEKVDTSLINIEKGKKTNYHYVLRYGVDRTILTKHERFEYKPIKKLSVASFVYLSSLGSHVHNYYSQIQSYLNKNKATRLAFQPGSYQIGLGYQKLKYFYKRAEIFVCNKEEAQKILNTKEKKIKKLIKMIAGLGPKITLITDGPRGAFAYDGKETYYTPMCPNPKPPIDRTGAGDAFAATFTSALILGKNIKEALKWACINSMSVVQFMGAQRGLLKLNQLIQTKQHLKL